MNRVVFFSRGGNTKRLADAVAKGVGTSAVPADQFSGSADVLFIGASIYAGSIDAKLRQFLVGLKPSQARCVVVFGTSAGKKTALPEVKSILEPHGIPVSDDAFHCKGSFLLANRGRPNDEDLKQAEAFAKRICGDRP